MREEINGSAHCLATAFGQVDMAVNNTLPHLTRHGLAATLECDVNLGRLQ